MLSLPHDLQIMYTILSYSSNLVLQSTLFLQAMFSSRVIYTLFVTFQLYCTVNVFRPSFLYNYNHVSVFRILHLIDAFQPTATIINVSQSALVYK